MLQLTRNLSFFDEPHHTFRRLVAIKHYLHGHFSSDALVLGIQHRAHPALGDQFTSVILVALFVDQGIRHRIRRRVLVQIQTTAQSLFVKELRNRPIYGIGDRDRREKTAAIVRRRV